MDRSDAQVRLALRTFVLDTFLTGAPPDHLDDSASLLEERIVDSTGVIELVSYIESTFGIAVSDRELVPENLDSIDRLCAFVQRKAVSRAI